MVRQGAACVRAQAQGRTKGQGSVIFGCILMSRVSKTKAPFSCVHPWRLFGTPGRAEAVQGILRCFVVVQQLDLCFLLRAERPLVVSEISFTKIKLKLQKKRGVVSGFLEKDPTLRK